MQQKKLFQIDQGHGILCCKQVSVGRLDMSFLHLASVLGGSGGSSGYTQER